MTAECRPPDGTPDGTVCWLYDDILSNWLAVPWIGECWYLPCNGSLDPEWMASDGYRFHSIVTPPEDAK